MKFLDWLLGGDQRPAPTPLFEESRPDPKKFKQVPKWTHAGRAGKTIYCPECGGPAHVHNFAWSALSCSDCKAVVGKYKWLLPVTRKKRKKRKK